MKKCDKCGITINTKQQYCPLCHQVLNGETYTDFKEVYPEYVSLRRQVLPITKKILLFFTIISIIILGIINIADRSGVYWSFIPIGSIIYFWFLVRVGVFSRRNIAFRIALLTVLLILLLIYVDYSTTIENDGWSTNYVMPILLLSSVLAITFIIWLRRINYRDYFFYLLIILTFSIVPLILAFANVVTVFWPSITAFGAATFILLFIIFFFPKSIKEEIKKRFHA
ncbi:MAG: hypothetical protein KAU02_02030 [Tenericutes bacterium]|nr:hypothetical protein [Mycoplasmatota bacterium]